MSSNRDARTDSPRREGASCSPEELLEALRASFPDLELLDAGVVVDGSCVADLVARTGERWLLVRTVEGRGRAAAHGALDVVARARRTAPWLAHHLGLETPPPPLVALVAPRFGRGFRERLSALSAQAVVLLELHRVESARGQALLALPLGSEGASRAGSAPAITTAVPSAASPPGARREPGDGFERFAEQLDPADRGVGRDLCERIGRIDPDLSHSVRNDGIVWSLGGRELCALEVEQGRLIGRLCGSQVQHRLSTPFAADHFLDWVLAAHLERIGADSGSESGRRGEERCGHEMGDGEEHFGEALHPAAPEPLLTPEEIEAFRE